MVQNNTAVGPFSVRLTSLNYNNNAIFCFIYFVNQNLMGYGLWVLWSSGHAGHTDHAGHITNQYHVGY